MNSNWKITLNPIILTTTIFVKRWKKLFKLIIISMRNNVNLKIDPSWLKQLLNWWEHMPRWERTTFRTTFLFSNYDFLSTWMSHVLVCALQEIVRPHRILIYSCKIELLLNNNSNNNTNTNNNNNNELIIPGKFYLFNDMIIVGKAVTYKGEIKYQILHLIILKKNHNLKQDKGTKTFAYSIHKILWCFILIDLWISSSRQYSPNHNKWWWGCLLSLCTKRLWRDYQKAHKFVENTK